MTEDSVPDGGHRAPGEAGTDRVAGATGTQGTGSGSGTRRTAESRPGAGADGTTRPGPGPAGSANPGSAAPGSGAAAGTPGQAPGPAGSAEPAPPTGVEAVPRCRVPLRRSKRHRVVGGVCGGFGRYFDVDPVIFRVVLAILAITGGIGLLVYGAAWLLIPAHGQRRNEAQHMLSGRVEAQGMAAVLTALVGCGFFLSTVGSDGGSPFPLLVIAAVCAAVFWSRWRRRSREAVGTAGGTAASVGDAPPAAQPPPRPGAAPWWKDQPTGYLWGPDDGPFDEMGGEERVPPPAPPPAPPREPRSMMPPAVFALAVCAAVAGTAAAWSRPLGTALEVGLGGAVAVFGAGLVVASRFGRARGGTIFWATLTGVLLAGAGALPKSVDHTWRDQRWAPANAAAVQPVYELGTGRARLDLGAVDPGGTTVRVRAEVGAGRLMVRVPDNVRVEIRGRIGVGIVELPTDGRGHGDIDVSFDESRRSTVAPAAPVKERHRGTIRLDLKVGVGQLEVSVDPAIEGVRP
jgi:phage shock protein PspC (stress-responsive transcriptional regulator)